MLYERADFTVIPRSRIRFCVTGPSSQSFSLIETSKSKESGDQNKTNENSRVTRKELWEYGLSECLSDPWRKSPIIYNKAVYKLNCCTICMIATCGESRQSVQLSGPDRRKTMLTLRFSNSYWIYSKVNRISAEITL